MVSVRVPGFTPSVNGFHFSNSFINAPDIPIRIGPIDVGIGNASNGLCGGMIYAVRDLFESNILPPSTTVAPASGALFDYMVARLFDSFDLPGGPLKYLHFMDPALPDHETIASRAGLAPHGRAWATIREEWPLIKADLDAGKLSVLALVEVKTADPFRMGENHQVLAYGYDLDNRGNLSILIYDPNFPDVNTHVIRLNTRRPRNTTVMTCTSITQNGGRFHCLFRSNYRFVQPPSTIFQPVPVPRTLRVTNNTNKDQAVRIFKADDIFMVLALGGGEFTVASNMFATWAFPPGIDEVSVVANGRPIDIAMPDDNVVIELNDTVFIRNLTNSSIALRLFKFDDPFMLATLPGGSFSVNALSDATFEIPVDVTKIKIVGAGTRFAVRGDVILIGP